MKCIVHYTLISRPVVHHLRHLLQNTGHSEGGQFWEGGAEVVHLAAVRVALLHVLLRPREPRELTANIRAPNISRDGRLILVGIVEAHKSDTSLCSRIVQHLPEHARHGHFVGGSSHAQIQIYLVVVGVGQRGTTLCSGLVMLSPLHLYYAHVN